MYPSVRRILPDLAATAGLASSIARLARAGDAILLEGPLGAGKSAFARAFLRAATGDPALDVPSPTFTLVQTYESARGKIHHFDLWRLDGPEALGELGWEDAREDIVIVEWPERLKALRPADALTIIFTPVDDDAREATLSGWPDRFSPRRFGGRPIKMHLATIPAETPFLDTLAARWLAASSDDPSRGMILLPTRRAARALAEAFLRVGGGRPMLLPRIIAIGALDETPLTLAGALDLPPAVEPAERLAVLARMVLALPEDAGGVRAADRAWRLARELAALLDEAERAEIDFPDALTRAADAAHALHWDAIVRFLGIATRAWPAWLAEAGLMDPVARQVALLRAQAAAWRERPPDAPVWAAGVTAAFPAIAALLRTVARLERGRVIFPGLDQEMPDAAWGVLRPNHPQAGFFALLAAFGARRSEVAIWRGAENVPAGRPRALAASLLPAEALGAWRERVPVNLGALSHLAAADAQEEAVAIALVLRGALETPGRRAALVTPDRALAGRVAAELSRWGIVADDSAGESLAQSPPAVFLRLLAQAVAENLAPVALLSLLKHPLAAAGMTTASCRAAARALEKNALRGPKPMPGLAGLRLKAGEPSQNFVAALEHCLQKLLRIQASVVAAPAAQLAALVESAEHLAATDTLAGPARLWAHEEGEALAGVLAGAITALEMLPDQKFDTLPSLLDALLEGEVVRSRRALRGRDAAAEHPRVFIWGLLEARLQSVDLIVLGGLVEGVWPPATDPGPWMSRQMRARAGLDDPEARIGQAAHDFVAAACAAPEVVLSAPSRRDGAPAVPSRFLVRLRAWLDGQGVALPAHPAADWARRLDQPAGPPRPVTPPAPRPPAHVRPRRLAVTEIETLIADPYAIHARHILRLRPLDPLEQSTDSADYGALVHAALHDFLASVGTKWPPDARARLRGSMDQALSKALLREALAEWWAPRLLRIADWVADEETRRRAEIAPALIRSEVKGEVRLDIGGPFRLIGRADRIERRPDGLLAILDYKTGAVPNQRDVADGEAPQLTLEAAMARVAAFGPELTGEAAELAYWHLTGGFVAGKATPLFKSDPEVIAAAIDQAAGALEALLTRFSREETPYLSQPHPGRRPRFPDYAHLARCAEWDAAEDVP